MTQQWMGADKRFRLDGRLGSGGQGVVYRAYDRVLGFDVALKTLHSSTPRELVLLKREFRIARDIEHPNLVRLHDLIVEPEGTVFFTMEVLDGEPLRPWVWGEGHAVLAEPAGPAVYRLDDAATERAGRAVAALAAALDALHSANIVHRDVKPHNVVVVDDRPVLLDFGVARRLEITDASAEGSIAGTPAYMAPELADGVRPTIASDAYSLGVVLFELLTGRVPFGGSFFRQFLAKRRDGPPPVDGPPSARARELVELASRLLAPQPEDRPTLSEVASGLRTLGVSLTPTPIPLVGRAAELDWLAHQAQTTVARRQARRVDLVGPSGVGKTRLVTDFLRSRAGALLPLQGACHVQEAVAFQGLDAAISVLVGHLCRVHRPPPELLPRLTALLEAFPDVALVADVDQATLPRQYASRRAAHAALRSVLDWLTHRTPVVLWIDDAQWGDADGAAFVEALLTPPLEGPLLVLLSHRPSDHDGGFLPALAAAPPSAELELGPLGEAAASELLSAVAGERTGAHFRNRRTVARLGGTPFLITEVGRVLREEHEVGASADADLLGALVDHRLAGLHAGAATVLAVAAVAAGPLRRDALAAAAGLEPRQGSALIDRLCAARLLRRLPAAETVDVFHDRVAATVIGRLPAADVARLHGALADALAHDPEACASRARHLFAAGRYAEASAPAQQAALDATRSLAFQRAVSLFELARECALRADQQAFDHEEPLAEARAAVGDARGAADAFLTLAAQRPDGAAAYLQRAAELLLGAGFLREGKGVVTRLLDRVALPRLPPRWLRPFTMLWMRASLWLRGLDERIGREPPDQRLLDRIDACWTLSSVFGLFEFTAGAQARHLALALRAGDPDRLLRALAMDLINAGLPSPHGRWVHRVEAVAAGVEPRASRPDVIAFYALARGYLAFLRGQLQPSLDHLDDCCERYAATRAAHWAYNHARAFRTYVLMALGRVRDATEHARPLRLELHDIREQGIGAYLDSHGTYLIELANDDPDAAEAALVRAESTVAARSFVYQIVLARACIALYRGDPVAARLALGASRLARAESFLIQYGRIFTRWIEGLVLLAGEPFSARVGRLARAIEREGCDWASGMVAALRSGLSERRGDRTGAVRWAADAAARFDRAGLALYAAAQRAREAALVDDDDRRVTALGDIATRGVANPAAWCRFYAPAVRPRDSD